MWVFLKRLICHLLWHHWHLQVYQMFFVYAVHIYRNIPPAVRANDLWCILTPCKPPPEPSPCQLGHLSRCHCFDFVEEAMSGNIPTSKMFCLIPSIPPGCPTCCFRESRGQYTVSQSVELHDVWQLKQIWRCRIPPPLPPKAGQGTHEM